MQKSKEWTLGFGELKYLFFNKKRCKKCGAKMKKITTEEYIGEKKWIDNKGIKSESENYKVEIFYYCSHCDEKYSLEELSNGKE